MTHCPSPTKPQHIRGLRPERRRQEAWEAGRWSHTDTHSPPPDPRTAAWPEGDGRGGKLRLEMTIETILN